MDAKMIFKNSAPSLTSRLLSSVSFSNEIPAMKAPTMADRPTSSATIAYRNANVMAKMKMNSGYFATNCVLSSFTRKRLTTRIPTAPATTRNTMTFTRMKSMTDG